MTLPPPVNPSIPIRDVPTMSDILTLRQRGIVDAPHASECSTSEVPAPYLCLFCLTAGRFFFRLPPFVLGSGPTRATCIILENQKQLQGDDDPRLGRMSGFDDELVPLSFPSFLPWNPATLHVH